MSQQTIEASSSSAEQVYNDILPRINDLVNLSGEALEQEMKILKKALMENPDASNLMLPEDIGKTVAALRRMTGQAQATAAAKPKKGAKEKKVALTAADMEAAFEEL